MRISYLGIKGHNNRRMPRRRDSTEGSVTIFLIMVLAFIFLFTTVLIDYARIAAANVQGERMAKAAVRSVMSSYDVDLLEKYGLFAFGSSDGNMLLSEVLNDSLNKSGREDAFNLLPLSLDSSRLNWSRPLGQYDIFRREISEDMKYKAPIDFTLELAGKFKPLSAAMGEASRATDVLSKLQPLYDKREEALDLMLERRRKAAESGKSLARLIMDPPADYIPSSSLGNVSTAADIAAQYNDYTSKYYADEYRDSKKPPKYSYALYQYSSQSSEVISQLPAAMETFRQEHERFMQEAENDLERARGLNAEMKSVLEQSRSTAPDPADDPAGSWDIPGSTGGMNTEPLRRLREQEDSLILPAADFEQMKSNWSAQGEAYMNLAGETAGLPGVLSAETSSHTGDGFRMVGSVLNASRVTYAYLGNYSTNGTIIGSEAAWIEEHRSSDQERKQLEKQAKAKLGDVMNMLEQIRGLRDKAGEAQARYDTLHQYYEESIAFNKGLEQESLVSGPSSDPYAAGTSAMDNMDGIYEVMGSIMQGAQNRIFQTEYAALYFNPFDVTKLTSINPENEGTNVIEQLADQLDPNAQELEYILYGFHNPAGNVAAAYGEIFAMRLAIRTMEGFIEKAGAGNPLFVLAAAVLYGIEQAVRDMLELCRDGSIPLSKYLAAELTYRDYLRLFMMLHGSGDTQLSRMLALIRMNTGINPATCSTYASAEVKYGMRLWFLPGIIKLLNYSDGLPGEVKDGVYYRTVQADFAY